MRIKKGFFVFHGHLDFQCAFKTGIKINEMWITIVQNCPFRPKSERHREAAAEWLNQPPLGKVRPIRQKMPDQPPLAARPFQRWSERSSDQVLRHNTDHPSPTASGQSISEKAEAE